MPQAILLTGTILASSIGCALIALVLRSALRNARRRSDDQAIRDWETLDAGDALQGNRREAALQGYDTPELYREDLLSRMGRSEKSGWQLH
jgi:hypothetical protein